METTQLLLIIFGLFLIFLLISVSTQGINATAWLLLILGVIISCIAVVLFILWVIYNAFFKPKPVRMSKEVKKMLIQSAHISKPQFIGDLWLRGDKEHPPVRVGKILGVLPRERYIELGKTFAQINKKMANSFKKIGIKKLRLQETYFTFKFYTSPFFWRFGEEKIAVAIGKAWGVLENGEKYNHNGKEVIINEKSCEEIGGEWKDGICEILIPELTQHSPLLGDVEIYAIGLVNVNGIYMPPQNETTSLFDRIMISDEARALAHYVYDELATLTGKAIQSNVQHKIEMEERKVIPVSELKEVK